MFLAVDFCFSELRAVAGVYVYRTVVPRCAINQTAAYLDADTADKANANRSIFTHHAQPAMRRSGRADGCRQARDRVVKRAGRAALGASLGQRRDIPGVPPGP